jgi:hypothetical protein
VLSEMVSVMAAEGASEEVAAVSLAASCLLQPASAQVLRAARTAQLSVFLKIDIGTSFLNENNKNINNGLLFQNYNNTNTYRKYYSCPGYGWQEMIAPE